MIRKIRGAVDDDREVGIRGSARSEPTPDNVPFQGAR